jgi:hypothetical protein
MRNFFCVIITVFFAQFTFGQETQMMVAGQRINTNNYFEIIRQFDDYWQSRPDRFRKGMDSIKYDHQ